MTLRQKFQPAYTCSANGWTFFMTNLLNTAAQNFGAGLLDLGINLFGKMFIANGRQPCTKKCASQSKRKNESAD